MLLEFHNRTNIKIIRLIHFGFAWDSSDKDLLDTDLDLLDKQAQIQRVVHGNFFIPPPPPISLLISFFIIPPLPHSTRKIVTNFFLDQIP